MSDEEFLDEELPVLLLVDEDGVEHEFELLAEMEIEENRYRVLVPLAEAGEEDENEEVEVVILRLEKDEEGNEVLSDIDDDEEWEKVADAWQELAENEDL